MIELLKKRQPLASKGQVAAYLNVCTRTVGRYIASGKLPATYVGAQVRIRWPDVDALLAKEKVPVDDVTGNGLI